MRNALPLVRRLALALALAAALPVAADPFVYRGTLRDAGAPAEGRYGFRLTFHDAAVGGATLAPAIELDDVAVVAGEFSAKLELDPALRTRERAWLQVEVRDASGGYVPLPQRELVQPDDIAGAACWDTSGNAGTVFGDFLGTTDLRAVDFRVNNVRAFRIEPTNTGKPNVVGGADTNIINVPASAAVIGGGFGNAIAPTAGNSVIVGGTNNDVNTPFGVIGGGQLNVVGRIDGTTGLFGTIAGGLTNTVSGSGGAVGGGASNDARGLDATIAGGADNCAGGDYSFAGGRRAFVRPSLSTAGSCNQGSATGESGGDEGTFLWHDSTANFFGSTGPDQFLVRAEGGIGFNTSSVDGASVTVAGISGSPAILRVMGSVADLIAGGRVLLAENGASPAGGYIDYDAFNNVYSIGTNNGTTDFDTLVLPRGSGRVGVGRTPATNALEVEGNASKTTATAWLANSDARIKRDIAPIANALDTIMRIRPVTFRYSDGYRAAHPSIDDRRYYNVVAQEFAQVFPDAVQRSGERLPGAKAGADGEILQVDVHPALITAIAAEQELAVRLEALVQRVEALEADNAALRERLADGAKR